MTYYSDRVCSTAAGVLASHIDIREDSSKVPDVADIVLAKNQGVLLDGCYVYADMVDSSTLGQRVKKPVSAKIIRAYINGASDILRHYGGEIRSFDGDRVMAIFVGADKETKAVRAALGINWFVVEYLRDEIHEHWNDLKTDNIYTLRHCIGIDTGEALITRTGVRGDNDLVSIGAAPNVAAKLSDLKANAPICITNEVYEPMSNEVAFTDDGRQMWAWYPVQVVIGGRSRKVLTSTWHWMPA